jgi:EAL and modified HD-GYP domain-containing signal transduction protein
MNVYTARQAIFNNKQNVVAYELFFRDGPENFFPANVDGHVATSILIARTQLISGIRPVASNKPALINFSEESILKELPFILNPKEVMIEILETVTPSDEVFEACKKLYHAGFKLVLDDFIYRPEWKRFFCYVSMIKFDISVTPLHKIEPLVRKLQKQKPKIKLLAEKIETKEEYAAAKKLGFLFFQGYFFCKPEMQKRKDIQSNQHIIFLLQREILRKELDHGKISRLFEQDSNLAYKLLRYINSGLFQLKNKISSIKQALVYLGDSQVRRMLSLITTSSLASDKPAELTEMCVIRAKFCEQVIQKVSPSRVESAFLMGMFSLLDAILDRPLNEVLETLPLEDDVKEALLKDDAQTPLAITIRLVKLLERGKWHETELEAKKLRIDYKFLADTYKSAIIWSDFSKQVKVAA